MLDNRGLIRRRHPAVQYHHFDGTPDAQRAALVCPVRTRGHRDKIAASKRKGIWMGGLVPLGYDGQSRVSASMMSSTIASAFARISSSVASWTGCGTKTRFSSGNPSASACECAASTNPVDAITTDGFAFVSKYTESCTLHVVHDPQSARPSTTKSTSSRI
jgi:hypothetical protein